MPTIPVATEMYPQDGNNLPLVGDTVARLRALILSLPAHSKLGSLQDLTKQLGVGVVTFQQASRLLERDGFLDIRRGKGGGYYGARPDKSSLERVFANFLWAEAHDGYEALRIKLLLELEVAQDAATSNDQALFAALADLAKNVPSCRSGEDRIIFENELQDTLFRALDKPLMETFMRVSMQYYSQRPIPALFDGEEGAEAWRQWRKDVIDGILSKEADIARFQAERHRVRLLERVRLVRLP